VILSLLKQFEGKKWRTFKSDKICRITFGRIQGKEALIEHFSGSNVMQQHDKSKKPLILPTQFLPLEILEAI